MEIKERELIKVKISELGFDNTNPNMMTKDQMDALRQSFQRFGYLAPIIVDQHNVVADGEHRVEIYKQFGRTEIPAFRVDFEDDSERRLLRQVMNKLHGTHDQLRDIEEFQRILEAGKLGDLASMIAEDEDKLLELLKLNEPTELRVEEEIKHDLDRYLLTFEFTNVQDYDLVLSCLKDLHENKETAIIRLVRSAQKIDS